MPATPILRSYCAPNEVTGAAGRPPDNATATTEPASRRKLAAILSADVKGFSRLMEADEEGTLSTLKTYRAIIDRLISRHDGRIVGTAGDSVLAEFASPVEATRCVVEIQKALARSNAELPSDRRVEFRIGINLGDVIVEGTDLFGDGVNVAARLQALADPGRVFISGGLYDQIKTKLPLGFEFLGERKVKNIAEPVRIYRLHEDPAAALRHRRAQSKERWTLISALGALVLTIAFGIWLAMPIFERAIDRFTGASKPVPLAGHASIAVLPFTNQGDAAEDYFSDGLTEDLISGLGRFSNLTVMSWNAVAPFKDQAVTPEQLAEQLPVRYVVDGSVRLAGGRVRITARLTDSARGALLWSERYDRTIDDLFALQDDITHHIVAELAVQVDNLEQQRASAKPTQNLTAYDLYLRGRQHFHRFTRAENLEARAMFEKALELDHGYADAYAALAVTYTKAAEMGWTEHPYEALERAHDLAQAALRLDPSNAPAHVSLATVYTYQRQFELALAELDRAIEANPNLLAQNAERGWVLLLAGEFEEATAALEEAMRYDPAPAPNSYSNLATAYYFQERYDEAILTVEGAIGRHPHHLPLHIWLAAAYAAAGRMEGAARAATDVRRLHPFFDAAHYGEFFRYPKDRDRVRADLREAGL
jgi:adenylate cyclase